jgi:2'-5' RNA ligase
MPATIRTFIGIAIPATSELREALQDLARVGRAVKATPPENLHLTLKFLGETPRSQVDEIAEAIREAAEAVLAHSIQLAGLGAFPNGTRPAVVWAAMSPAEHLERLAVRLDQQLEPLGFVPEARPFLPHLTLARVKGEAPGLPEFIDRRREARFGAATVASVDLFRSEPTPAGSRYSSLASARLSESA